MTKLTKKQESLLNELLEDFKGDPESILGQHGLMNELRKRVVEAMLDGELTSHLGYRPHDPVGHGTGNSRNGYSAKKVQSKDGELELEVPRDRNSSFEPQVLRKGQRRMDGIDDVIIALYARGLSTRSIQEELKEMYGAEVSPTLISNVTHSVLEEVQDWQARALDAVYPILYFDCLFVKSRQDGSIRNKAVYLALGINLEGEKELLGMWLGETEGAKFWLNIFNELKNRGVQDCFIACVDGLRGLPEAIETVYPHTQVQLCIVHQVRNSLRFCHLERPQTGGCGSPGDLHSADGGGRPSCAGGVCQTLGGAVSGDCAGLGAELGAPDPVLQFSARDPQGGLHYQRH